MNNPIVIDYSLIEDIQLANIKAYDMPDFVDAFIETCTYDGRPATDEELDEINTNGEYIYKCVMDYLY